MQSGPLRTCMKDGGLENHAFLLKALAYIESHPLFTHPFFSAFAAGKLSLAQVQAWAKQRVFPSRQFPRSLAAFVSHLKGDEMRMAYVKQIYEEQGELDPLKVHSRQLEQLVFTLGVSRRELNDEPILPSTQDFMDTYMNISRGGDIVKAMGMYALGSEPVIAMEMELCLQGLDTIGWLEPEDKVFFSDHAHHDYRHTAELIEVLLPFIRNEADQNRAWQGMVEIIDARKRLHDGIGEKIGL